MNNHANPRRGVLRQILGVLGIAAAGRLGAQGIEPSLSEAKERMKQAEEQDVLEVELLYSTKPVRVQMNQREYSIAANYFGPKQRDEPAVFDAGENGFGFFLFLPDYGGYTKENWRDPFDRRRIDVISVKAVDTNSKRDDPRAQFHRLRPLLEQSPSFKLYGLEGYRSRGARGRVTWAGTRSNGEFFFLQSSLEPGEQGSGIANPLCITRYYSEAEKLHISYFYSQDHIAKWQEIDDAIWAKLRSWRVK
jgi:hypothetical protein